MKIILKETSVDYKTYHFGYAINAILENEESIEKAYSKGFLPYTNDVFSNTDTSNNSDVSQHVFSIY